MTQEIPQQNKIQVSVVDREYILIREESAAGEESSILIHKDNIDRFCAMVKECAGSAMKVEGK